MKKLLFALIIVSLLTSCAVLSNYLGLTRPPAPYGNSDDTSTYYADDFASITYTYYCYAGQYIVVTYSHCGFGPWERSDFEAAGICKK